MSIVLSHIWRNIKDKKLVSALIILSLVITGALFFVALSIEGVLDTFADSDFQSVTTIFMLIFIVTSFMSVFVVFSSFKYIMAIRIKTLGTLRSIGAGKARCRRLLLLESLVYGLIGAALAMLIGIILLAVLSNSLSGGQAKVSVSPLNLLIAALFCLLLSPLCAFFPIKASDKYSVKEVILQTHTLKEKRRLPALATGLALLAVSTALVLIDTLKYEEAAIIVSFLFAIAGVVLCAGPLIYYFITLLSRVFKDSLTLKTLKENKSHNNIAILIAIAVAVVFMINSSNAILIDATDKSFELFNYDISIATKTNDALFDENTVGLVTGTAEVTAAAGIYFKTEVGVDGNIPIMNLYGMSLLKMQTYFNLTVEEEVSSMATKTILLSRDYLEREKLGKGDKVVIGGKQFEIAGVIREMFNSGNVGVISESDFCEIYGSTNYTMIAAKSDNPVASRDALRAAQLPAATIADMLTRVKTINADLFTTVDYIILLSTTAGVFGVLNNLLIAFMSQKRERALLRSIGMSQSKSAGAILTEALITGLAGGILGLIGGLILTAVIPAVFLVFEFPVMPVPLSPVAIALCLGCAVAICLIASLISLVGNSKLNIVQTLREEIL